VAEQITHRGKLWGNSFFLSGWCCVHFDLFGFDTLRSDGTSLVSDLAANDTVSANLKCK